MRPRGAAPSSAVDGGRGTSRPGAASIDGRAAAPCRAASPGASARARAPCSASGAAGFVRQSRIAAGGRRAAARTRRGRRAPGRARARPPRAEYSSTPTGSMPRSKSASRRARTGACPSTRRPTVVPGEGRQVAEVEEEGLAQRDRLGEQRLRHERARRGGPCAPRLHGAGRRPPTRASRSAPRRRSRAQRHAVLSFAPQEGQGEEALACR